MLGTLIIVPGIRHKLRDARFSLGASAVEVGVNQNLAAQYAKRTKAEQYGIYLMYNLPEKIHLRISRRRHKNFMVENELFTNCSNTLIIISCLQAPTCKELKRLTTSWLFVS